MLLARGQTFGILSMEPARHHHVMRQHDHAALAAIMSHETLKLILYQILQECPEASTRLCSR